MPLRWLSQCGCVVHVWVCVLTFCQAAHLEGRGSLREIIQSWRYRGRVQDLAMWSCLLLGSDFRKFFVRDATGIVLLRGRAHAEQYSAAQLCLRGCRPMLGVGFGV